MSKQSESARVRRGQRVGALLGAVALAALACGDVPIDSTNFQPQGTLSGSVVYSGPLPCVQRGHVLGAALMLVFNEDLLPPPDGLGTTAAQFGVVSGDVLFSSVVGELPASPADDPDRVVCPAADAPPVTVSARWTVGPLPAGRYQVRGFYDRDGDFSPVLKTHNLPTAGDVGGGAIANLDEALAGKPVRYQTFELGVPGADGKLGIPTNGASVTGATVTLGQTLHFSRPLFHVAAVHDERPASFKDKTGAEITAPPLTPVTDPKKPVLAQDERFLVAPTNYPAQATKMFLRLSLGAGLPGAYPQGPGEAPSERSLGAAAPYSLQAVPPHDYFWMYPAVNGDGTLKTVPETPPDGPSGVVKIANLFPQAIFAKLDGRDASGQTAQGKPAVILQGLVLNETLLGTTVAAFRDGATGAAKPPRPVQSLEVALRPSVICIPEPQDVNAPVYVVTPAFNAKNGEPIIDPASVAEQVRLQLGNRPNIKVIEGCLPKGKYQFNLVYDTGQAWTMPNEGGVCSTSEVSDGADGCSQGAYQRKLLPSQNISLEVGDPRESGFCAAQFPGADYAGGVPAVCLRADER